LIKNIFKQTERELFNQPFLNEFRNKTFLEIEKPNLRLENMNTGSKNLVNLSDQNKFSYYDNPIGMNLLGNFIFQLIQFTKDSFHQEKPDDEMDIESSEQESFKVEKEGFQDKIIEIDKFIASNTRLARAFNEDIISYL